jgi:hypothetical protein
MGSTRYLSWPSRKLLTARGGARGSGGFSALVIVERDEMAHTHAVRATQYRFICQRGQDDQIHAIGHSSVGSIGAKSWLRSTATTLAKANRIIAPFASLPDHCNGGFART